GPLSPAPKRTIRCPRPPVSWSYQEDSRAFSDATSRSRSTSNSGQVRVNREITEESLLILCVSGCILRVRQQALVSRLAHHARWLSGCSTSTRIWPQNTRLGASTPHSPLFRLAYLPCSSAARPRL